MLVFIDESGDPGFKLKRGSSSTFVLALVAFGDHKEAASTAKALDELARGLKIQPEFKFSGTRAEVRDAVFAVAGTYDFRVRAIVIEKEKIYSAHLRNNKEAFYSFFVKSMLQFNNGLLRDARIIIDGSGDRIFKNEMKSYLRKNVREGTIYSVKFSNSRGDRLVQLADMCAGAIARAYRPDRTDARRWLKMLRPKIDDIWDFK